MNLTDLAAQVIARARNNSGLTTPEFDYDIATHYNHSINGIGGQHSPLGGANHEIARERGADPDQQWNDLQDELQAYARKCRNRRYTGWSDAAKATGARIQYAN